MLQILNPLSRTQIRSVHTIDAAAAVKNRNGWITILVVCVCETIYNNLHDMVDKGPLMYKTFVIVSEELRGCGMNL